MASVIFKDVIKKFGSFIAVDDLDLEVRDREFLVLLGPSGCGKTTTMRMVAGLEDITSGDIFIGEDRVNDVLPKYRDVAMVFQSYALYPHLSVEENIGYPLRVRNVPKEERKRAVDEVARRVELDGLLGRLPKELSGGQRQRVALGRAIVREPQVFLFDEPLSNLDAKLRVQMRVEIKALHQRLRTTSVYVTHDQVEAMTMADRIVVMHDGRVEQIGSPLELYDHPANLFVAGFIGSPAMNFIEGALRRGGNEVWVATQDGIRLPVPRSSGRDGQDVIYGVRPEHLDVATDDAAGVPAMVEVVEPTGADTYVYATLAGKQVCAVFAERHDFHSGQTIRLLPKLDVIHLFDAQSGRKLD